MCRDEDPSCQSFCRPGLCLRYSNSIYSDTYLPILQQSMATLQTEMPLLSICSSCRCSVSAHPSALWYGFSIDMIASSPALPASISCPSHTTLLFNSVRSDRNKIRARPFGVNLLSDFRLQTCSKSFQSHQGLHARLSTGVCICDRSHPIFGLAVEKLSVIQFEA